MRECGICFHDFDDEFVPATLSCGHIQCYKCLERISLPQPNQPPGTCPTCRLPFKQTDIVKLFLTFPAVESEANELQEDSAAIAEPDSEAVFDEEEKAEAALLAERMSGLGIGADVDDLVKVLDDVKRWAKGVESIKDMETKIAVTRLLLSLDVLHTKAGKTLTSKETDRKTARELEHSKSLVANLQRQLSTQHETIQMLRLTIEEQNSRLDEVQEDLHDAKQELLQKEETFEIEGAEIREQVERLRAENNGLKVQLERSQSSAQEYRTKANAFTDDKRRYDKRIATLQKDLDTLEQARRDLDRKLRAEVEKSTMAEEDAEQEIEALREKLAEFKRANSELETELASKSAQAQGGNEKLLKLKRESEHWREEYFKLKDSLSNEAGSTAGAGEQSLSASIPRSLGLPAAFGRLTGSSSPSSASASEGGTSSSSPNSPEHRNEPRKHKGSKLAARIYPGQIQPERLNASALFGSTSRSVSSSGLHVIIPRPPAKSNRSTATRVGVVNSPNDPAPLPSTSKATRPSPVDTNSGSRNLNLKRSRAAAGIDSSSTRGASPPSSKRRMTAPLPERRSLGASTSARPKSTAAREPSPTVAANRRTLKRPVPGLYLTSDEEDDEEFQIVRARPQAGRKVSGDINALKRVIAQEEESDSDLRYSDSGL